MKQFQELVNNKINRAIEKLGQKEKTGQITWAEKQFSEKALYDLQDELNKLWNQMNKESK